MAKTMALTTMLYQGISTSTCRSRRTTKGMSMLWKILTIIVVLQACAVTISCVKQIKSVDFAFDDTFDIDQFDEETAISSVDESRGRKGRDLDEEALLQDELQPVAAAEDDANEDDSSWWTKGVKRVRRELGRFFGNGDEDETAAAQRSKLKREHKKRDNESRRHNKRQQQQQVGEEKEHKAKKQRMNKNKNHNHHKNHAAASASAPHDLRQEKKTKRLNAQAAKHNKRSYSDEEFDEGSGNFPDTDIGEEEEEEETEAPEMELYRTLFTVVEPWQEAYRQGPDSVVFMELHRQLETAFRDLYQTHYRDDDEDVDDESNIRVTLLEVGPTDDHFKIHVLIQIELPAKITNFDEVLSEQIATFRRLGGIGAEKDEHYYFRRINDANEPYDFPPDILPTTDSNGHGSAHDDGDDRHLRDDCYNNPSGYFTCQNGENIECYRRCDNYIDCDDGTDEDEQMCRLDEEPPVDRKHIYEVGTGTNDSHRDDEEGRGGAYDRNDDRYDGHENHPDQGMRDHNQEHHGTDRDDRLPGYDQDRDRENRIPDTNNRSEEEVEREAHNEVPDGDRDYVHRGGEATHREQDGGRTDQDDYDRRHPNYYEFNCDENPQGEFLCRDGEVIPCYMRCNGYPECRDASDEASEICTKDTTESITDVKTETDEIEASGDEESITAPTTETSLLYTRPTEEGGAGCRGDTTFVCPHSGHTICDIQRCDDHEDCPDGEDEYDCGGSEVGGNNGWSHHENVCTHNEFKCDDRCLPIEYQCNGVVDCADSTDEENCSHRVDRECSSTQFRCRSGECIEGHQRCDNRRDCPDGDDEDDNCATECSSIEYQCRDGLHCISESQLCDGVTDCSDADDEERCDGIIPKLKYFCPKGKFTCQDFFCISIINRCDGKVDCPHDRSDEEGCRMFV